MKYFISFALVLFLSTSFLQAQDSEPAYPSKYWSSGGEWIFSTGNVEGQNNVVRWSPVINLQNFLNFDRSQNFGWFTGVNLRNVGFIYDESPSIRKKFRTYNLGVPLGLKFGNLDKTFFYLGYELEIAFNYKEKTFVDERKTDKFNVWFSDRVNLFQSSVFAGVSLSNGTSIKFKYYPTGFFNQDFSISEMGQTMRPYENLQANIFYVSLSFDIFDRGEFSFGD
ncbi:hypothetical protein [Algoriphagus formosus]|uniref:hypothetical protein n=1 Tax=Algoriphagus formosus TaxID=2007308 RepID=UPI000C293FE8|nr:hypothetical protein [Algoriphagus formosus]